MATPVRMVELECPNCRHHHWELDNDFRGSSLMGYPELGYGERTYGCPGCQQASVGYRVTQKAPAEFFLQPDRMDPMTTMEFARWLAIFRVQFPSDDRHQDLGVSWYPGVKDDEQERKLYEARKIREVPQYRFSLVGSGSDEKCIRVRVEGCGQAGCGEAYFSCGSEVEVYDHDQRLEAEIANIRALLSTMTSEIRGAWERFSNEANEARARWLPKLLSPEETDENPSSGISEERTGN